MSLHTQWRLCYVSTWAFYQLGKYNWTCASFGPPESTTQTAQFSRFAQITVESPILYNGRRFPAKLAPSHGRMWTPISVMIPWASLSRQWRCSASQDSCISSPFYLIIHWSQQMIQYWYYSKTGCDGMGMCCEKKTLIMVALRNTADHYIFALWFLPSFFPRLIPAVGNWMSTILHTQCGLSAI